MFIKGGDVITPEGILHDVGIRVIDGRIIEIGESIKEEDKDQFVDADNCYVAPGFVDIHTHGGGGNDVTDCTTDALNRIAAFHASRGTTSIVATTLTLPSDEIISCLKLMRKFIGKMTEGSNILGVHMEGPFLSSENRGAHPEEYLLDGSKENYTPFLEYCDVIKRITVAPNVGNAPELIRAFRRNGVVVSGGHDNAITPEIEEAIQTGMSHTTHIFCAMSSISRRNGVKYSGLYESTLTDDRLTTEFIADGKHTDKNMFMLAYKSKGADGMCVVSDCLSASGMPQNDTVYFIGPKGRPGSYGIIVDEGVAMVPDRSVYAGSITTIDAMLRRMVFEYGIPVCDAVKMASATPAKIIHADGKGRIEPGKDADIVILDRKLNVRTTIVRGKISYMQNLKE